MVERCIYIWKLAPILNAEGSVTSVVQKAKRASISSLWVKIADGRSAYENVTGGMQAKTKSLIEKCHAKGIQVWGWHVPHCSTDAIAKQEVQKVEDISLEYELDGIIIDAEGGSIYFQGGVAEAQAYGQGMREITTKLNKPLAISSNDIPQNLEGWLPKFNRIALHADFNFPQVYYGGSPSVLNRLNRAENANKHLERFPSRLNQEGFPNQV